MYWYYCVSPSCLCLQGYNTWDDFRCGGINASNVMAVADKFVKYGLDKVGYEYIGIDDCWAVSRDKVTGEIVPNHEAFPDGMKALADYVHGRGFKFGICEPPLLPVVAACCLLLALHHTRTVSP